MAGYQITVYVDTTGLGGHAFIGLQGPNGDPVIRGYYPIDDSLSSLLGTRGPGDLRNDATTGLGGGIHHYDWSKTVDISAGQYYAMRDYMDWVQSHPGTYGVLGNNCAGFVHDVLT